MVRKGSINGVNSVDIDWLKKGFTEYKQENVEQHKEMKLDIKEVLKILKTGDGKISQLKVNQGRNYTAIGYIKIWLGGLGIGFLALVGYVFSLVSKL